MSNQKTFVTLSDLGKNEKELAKNLNMIFQNNNVNSIYIKDIDLKITKESAKILGLINEYFLNAFGRPKISYPLNWQENYILYKKGIISSKVFMDTVSLKRTTFYKLLKNYEQMDNPLK